MEELFLVVLGLGAILFLPVMAIAGFVRASRLKRDVAALTRRVAQLESRLVAGAPAPVSTQAAEATATTTEPKPATESVEAPPSPVEPPVVETPAPVDTAVFVETKPPRPSLEERIASRWAVWLGGGTIGLSAIFLVRYSIEQGLLGPTARIVLGLLLGLVLLAASEWMRRRVVGGPAPGIAGRLGAPPANLPPAVAAAGVVALFAAIYAALALYSLIGPTPAFIGLALVSALAMALSLLHGPMVALLGLAAAFAVPALAGGRGGGALPLFTYILAVAGGSLALARYRDWRWTMWVALAGSMGWLALWFLLFWRQPESIWIAVFLVALASFHLAPTLGPVAEEAPPREPLLSRDLMPDVPVLVLALAAFSLMRMADYDGPSNAALLGIFVIGLFMARRQQRLDLLALALGAIVVAAIACWHIPQLVEHALTGERLYPGDVLTPTAWRFLGTAALFGAAALGAGVISLGGAARPWRWAALATVVPLALFAVGYWRTQDFVASYEWGLAALALAAVFSVLVQRLMRHRDAPGMALAVGCLAIGVTTAVSFCFATILRSGWLSVALSIQVVVLAWVAARLDLRELRWPAALLAAVLVVRLILNPWVLDYALGQSPVINALIWIYGIPTLAFAFGAMRFARDGRDWAVEALEIAAIAFFVVLVTAEIRHAQGGGRLDGDIGGLMECALHAAAWLAIALALYAKGPALGSRIATGGAWVLGTLGTFAAIFGSLVIANPLDSTEAVGGFPLFNALGLAYLVPALIFGGFAYIGWRRGAARLAIGAGVGALVFGFVYLSLEVTRAFRGSVLSVERGGDGELYAYSAVWLLYGIVLLVGGIRWSLASLRYAALGVVGITILKVFLYDMAALAGILRVLSFLGLGVSLLALAWVYQRFVMTAGARPAA
ncbi:MAG: DUF2339 domain-containing protein [Alphaproteobacteria bacterium]|nr:DUF2339 domain-containing protein [Alphaproteobacteria bacterium]